MFCLAAVAAAAAFVVAVSHESWSTEKSEKKVKESIALDFASKHNVFILFFAFFFFLSQMKPLTSRCGH